MEIVILETVVVGFGLLTCGFFIGRPYWQSKIIEFMLENKFIKINRQTNELIPWNKN